MPLGTVLLWAINTHTVYPDGNTLASGSSDGTVLLKIIPTSQGAETSQRMSIRMVLSISLT